MKLFIAKSYLRLVWLKLVSRDRMQEQVGQNRRHTVLFIDDHSQKITNVHKGRQAVLNISVLLDNHQRKSVTMQSSVSINKMRRKNNHRYVTEALLVPKKTIHVYLHRVVFIKLGNCKIRNQSEKLDYTRFMRTYKPLALLITWWIWRSLRFSFIDVIWSK